MSCELQEVLKEVATRSLMYAGTCFLIQHISPILSPIFIPGFQKLKAEGKASNWYNRNVSFVHATLMFSRAYHFWTTKENWHWTVPTEAINTRTISAYESLTIDIMIGYLIYDTIYELRNNKGVALMLAHHVVGFFSHVLTRALCSGPASYYTYVFVSS